MQKFFSFYLSELQIKIAVYQREVETREQEISQLKKGFEDEMCAFRDQNGLDKVLKNNLFDFKMECERFKKELYMQHNSRRQNMKRKPC